MELVLFVFNPIIITIIAVTLAAFLLARLKPPALRFGIAALVLAAIAVYYVIDGVAAHKRTDYARQSPDAAVIDQTTPMPARLVLVNLACGRPCLDRLIARVHEEVFTIHNTANATGFQAGATYRFTVERAAPGDCPPDPDRNINWAWDAATGPALAEQGICPVIARTENPTEGIFVVNEGVRQSAPDGPAELPNGYLVDRPPPAFEFRGIEVQRRTAGAVEVLAHARYYFGPGALGLPPLFGC